MTTSTYRQGTGWLLFSGVMLVLAGLNGILDGLWALDNDDAPVDTILFENELGTWGWIYLIVGIIVFVAGFGVVSRQQWARFVGIFAAIVFVFVRLPWVFTYPTQTFIAVLLGVLVIYGLSVYGEPDTV
jgi:hypothetical protein